MCWNHRAGSYALGLTCGGDFVVRLHLGAQGREIARNLGGEVGRSAEDSRAAQKCRVADSARHFGATLD